MKLQDAVADSKSDGALNWAWGSRPSSSAGIRSLEGEFMIPGETVLSQQALGMKFDPHTGEFKVMKSEGTGLYYIGTMFLACVESSCNDCKDYIFGDRVLIKGQELDYNSRETDYFKTKEAADAALETYKKTGELPEQRF